MSDSRREYRLTPRSELDLEEIWLYSFEKWGLAKADSYHNDIVQTFEGLASGRLGCHGAYLDRGYLKRSVGSHTVYFRAENGEIQIIRILHQSMDAERHL
jgi:toxin ParE1/3/4